MPIPGWPPAGPRRPAPPWPDPGRAGYFAFALDDAAPQARRLERLVAWRCRVLALPYGDQGLLISRALYDAVGGFRPLPLMEDVDLVRRLGRRRLAALPLAVDHLGRALAAGGLAAALRPQPGLPGPLVPRRAAGDDPAAVRMRRDALILFARAPRLGTVKRRLAQGIGAMAALRFYRGQLRRLVREFGPGPALAAGAGGDAGWRPLAGRRPAAAAGPAATSASGCGRALGRHRRAVLVGSDIPGLGRADVAAAFRALGRADAVFGPSEDGGYWLVGFGPRRPAQPFAGVRWSTGHALADTLANFRGHRVALLRRLRDVDTAEDLEAAR